MVHDITRILIETIVKKTLKDLEDSPKRSTRNLVNMALEFSEGRFQRNLFNIAQTMLENEQSPYYDLIEDGVTHVEKERLLQFGMNLGYNSCTLGAKEIRKREETCGFNIPWAVAVHLDGQRLTQTPELYDSVISQGEEMGIYTWMLYAGDQIQDTLALMRRHTDSAFILFCEPADLTLAVLDCLSDVKHMMLVVRYDENTPDTYQLLRERQLLYSVFEIYGEADAESILSGDFFYSAQQLHPLFAAVIPGGDCSKDTAGRVYQAVLDARTQQTFCTFPWDARGDSSYVDSIISDGACSARFDVDGCLVANWEEKTDLNFFTQSLTDIFRQAFPKADSPSEE